LIVLEDFSISPGMILISQDAMLLSSDMGYNIYQKLGFKEYCKIQSYLWMPPEEE
jgi:hypothetical protein